MYKDSILIILLVITVIFLTTQTSLTDQLSKNKVSDNHAEDTAQQLQHTQLTKKIIIALRAEGYHPDSTLEYLIDSSNNKIITIHLHNLKKLDNRTESKIQKIVTSIAKKNHFKLFIVNVQLANVD